MIYFAGQLLIITGSQSYRDPPRYARGHAGPLAGTLPTFVTTAACAVHLCRRNAAKRPRPDDPAQHEQPQAERVLSYDMVGDGHPDFFTPLTR